MAPIEGFDTILRCNDCKAKVNPLRVFMGGRKYICVNCEHMHDNHSVRVRGRKGKNTDITPPKRSRSFQNKTRGNKNINRNINRERIS